MPYDGSGTFTRVTGWVADATAGIKIRADRHDLQDDDFTNGLSLVITRDGQTQPTNNIPLNGHRVTNVGDPTNDGDVATKGWLARTPFTVTGADNLGRIKFQGTEADAPAGKPLGFEWAQSDMFFGVRKKPATQPPLPAPAVPAAWVWNDKADASGTDRMRLDRDTGLLTVRDLGITRTVEVQPTGYEICNGYLLQDGSAWKARQAGTVGLQIVAMPNGDGGYWQWLSTGGAAGIAKDATATLKPRFLVARRGGIVVYPSENTHGILVQRADTTFQGGGAYGIHCTAPYLGGGIIAYDYSQTYYSIMELYNTGTGFYSFYGTTSALLGAGSWLVSDARNKENQRDESRDHACDAVKRLPVISYERRSERIGNARTGHKGPIHRERGWRAQDVQKVLPQAVREIDVPQEDMLHRTAIKGLNRIPDEGSKEHKALKAEKITMLTLNDHELLSTLWAATQVLIERVEKLEAA